MSVMHLKIYRNDYMKLWKHKNIFDKSLTGMVIDMIFIYGLFGRMRRFRNYKGYKIDK